MTRSHVVGSVMVLLMATVAAQAQDPPPAKLPALPFVDMGACPFEGCVYRDWTVKTRVVTYETWDSRAPVRQVFATNPGETVTAMTGVVLVTSVGRALIRRQMTAATLLSEQFPTQRPSERVSVLPGTLVYLLTSHGEGFYTAWVNGVLVGFDITNLEQPNTPGAGYSGCVRTQTCDGEVLEYPRRTWWVRIRNAAGQIGWTSQTQAFDGYDAYSGR
jgi:hypothetical protein